jgi:hypothetical protein
MMTPKDCHAYYYGGLPLKGTRRKGRLSIEDEALCFRISGGKQGEKVDLKIPFSKAEKIFLTRDNYYGSDTILFNLTFRDQADHSFTLRFAPIALIPRRRIALQNAWADYLAEAINVSESPSPLSTR